MPPGGVPTPDYAGILANDTRLTWLQRTDLDHYWGVHPATGEPVGTAGEDDPLSGGYYFCTISEAEFTRVKNHMLYGAPVWPGIADVTPGAPVALTDGLVLAGPMHGVLLDLTVLPSGGTAWLLGATRIPYNWGQVGFMSDNGEMEAFQWLSAEHSVYLPRQLAVAASASFRVTRPCTATVTPFTIP